MVLLRIALFVSLVGGCIDAQRAGSDTNPDSSAPDTSPDPDAAEPCESQGTTRCAGVEATQICSGGTWQTVLCDAGRICVDFGGAQCLEATGDDTCRDVLYCMGGCQLRADAEDGDDCLVECFISGSGAAQRELGLVTSCLDVAGCSKSGVDELACIAESCSQPLALCYFEGSGQAGCARLAQCVQGCEDMECYDACGAEGSVAAQAEFAVLDLCVQYVCFGEDDACTREATSAGGPCFSYTTECLSPL